MTSFNMERRVYRWAVAARPLRDADETGDPEQVEGEHDPGVDPDPQDLLRGADDQAGRIDGGDDDADAPQPGGARGHGGQDRLAREDVREQEQRHLHLVPAEDVPHREADATE